MTSRCQGHCNPEWERPSDLSQGFRRKGARRQTGVRWVLVQPMLPPTLSICQMHSWKDWTEKELGQVQWNQSDVCEEGGKPTGEPQWGDPSCTPFLVIRFLNEKQDF